MTLHDKEDQPKEPIVESMNVTYDFKGPGSWLIRFDSVAEARKVLAHPNVVNHNNWDEVFHARFIEAGADPATIILTPDSNNPCVMGGSIEAFISGLGLKALKMTESRGNKRK